MRCSSSWSSRSRNCMRCSWTYPCSLRIRERWSTGRLKSSKRSNKKIPSRQNWCSCGECCGVHYKGNKWYQESSWISDKGKTEKDHDASLYDHRRKFGDLYRAQVYRPGLTWHNQGCPEVRWNRKFKAATKEEGWLFKHFEIVQR